MREYWFVLAENSGECVEVMELDDLDAARCEAERIAAYLQQPIRVFEYIALVPTPISKAILRSDKPGSGMHFYVCQRSDDDLEWWQGALLIVAHSEDEAIALFKEQEAASPKRVHRIANLTASGDPRVIYDHESS